MSNRPAKRSKPLQSTARSTSGAGAGSGASGRPRSAPAAAARRSRTPWIVGGVIVLIVLVAAIVAIVSSGSDDGGDAAPAPGAGGSSPAVTVPVSALGGPSADGESRAVTVSGNALIPLGDGSDAAIGQTIPTASGEDFAGNPVEIGPGANTLLVFVAHWCPHCQNEVPRLVEWHDSGDVPAGLDVIAVSTGVNEPRGNYPPSAWLQREGWPWPVLADDTASSVGAAFGLSSFPYFVLYDAQGAVRWRATGELSMDELTQRIEAALA